jgi:hypothetical protein
MPVPTIARVFPITVCGINQKRATVGQIICCIGNCQWNDLLMFRNSTTIFTQGQSVNELITRLVAGWEGIPELLGAPELRRDVLFV